MRRNKEQDKRMKFGKFAQKAKEASRLKKAEVKTWDPDKKQLVSNKDNKPRYDELTGKENLMPTGNTKTQRSPHIWFTFMKKRQIIHNAVVFILNRLVQVET